MVESGIAARFGRLVGIASVVGICVLTGGALPAQAATIGLYAAPTPAGAEDCSSPANACTLATAVTSTNAATVGDSVQIKLARGVYLLSAPEPTALEVTFEGPVAFEAPNGTATISGTKTVRPLSVGPTSTVTIDGVDFEFGTTTGLGGAIENQGTLTVRNASFSSNVGANGGAISSAAGSTLTVEDSTFSHNSTTSVGGGALIVFGTATVVRSAITDNTAPVNGGGINVQPGGNLTFSNSTAAGNVSGSLGGAFSNLGTLSVQSSTIADNTATGGAALATGNENAVFTASLIGTQSSETACSPIDSPGFDGGYNLDTDGTCVSAETPATGSHAGTVAYGSSTYGDTLDSFLADKLGGNGGPTRTFALLNTPNPFTTAANPALGAVPPSFALTAPVGGVSAACSLPDQRGVLPAAGINCDIGAYLLQPTRTTVLTSAAKIGQKKQVTYTATVTPAPVGGTVSFDDGAGNPATTACAAQSLTKGTATCTVSYGRIGTYSTAASYSGDGGANDYAASRSTAPATTKVVDRQPPSAPKQLKASVKGTKLQLTWKAATDQVGVKRYQVLRNSRNVAKSVKASVHSVTIPLAFYGGKYAVRALDAAGNAGKLTRQVNVQLTDRRTKTYRIATK